MFISHFEIDMDTLKLLIINNNLTNKSPYLLPKKWIQAMFRVQTLGSGVLRSDDSNAEVIVYI